MALKQIYTSPDGVVHPDCYWKVVETNINHLRKTGRITLCGWHSKTERDDEMGILLGAEKAVTIKPEMYEDYFSSDALDVEGSNVVKQAYILVTTEDAISLGNSDMGIDGEGGKPVYDNFFVGAETI